MSWYWMQISNRFERYKQNEKNEIWILNEQRGDYTDSVRTSGEVVGVFVRDNVVCKLVWFIAAKVHLFLKVKPIFKKSNKFLMVCLIFGIKKTPWLLFIKEL